jgi:hypothetical protein
MPRYSLPPPPSVEILKVSATLPSRIVAHGVIDVRDGGPDNEAAALGETSWGFRVRRYRLFLQ